MLNYIIIGVVVQLIIIVERVIRLPEARDAWASRDFGVYVSILVGAVINILAWPIAAVSEAFLIYCGI